ncbi:MAG: RNA polymerase sigma factor RpoD/SigA [Candidatus Zixiibacteriota bacterium]
MGETEKLHIFDKLADEIGERKTISKKQLDEIIKYNKWEFEPGEVEDFLTAHDIVLLEDKKKRRSRGPGSNVWLYSQELSRVKILSREEELKTAYKMRAALHGMLSLIPVTTVTIQRFIDLSREPEFYTQFRLAPDDSIDKHSQSDTLIIMERIADNLNEIKQLRGDERKLYIENIQKDMKMLQPTFKVFDRMEVVFEKLANRLNENKVMRKTIANITGKDPEEFDTEPFQKRKIIDDSVAEMFHIKDILKHEAFKTYHRWDRWRKQLELISLVEPSKLLEKISQYRQYMDKYQTAKRKLVEGNVRLVMNIAKNYAGYGVDYLDLVQEGNHALLNAVERFDPDRGYRLATYTIWWIRQGIMQLIARQSRSIRIPTYVISWVRRFGAARRTLRNQLGRPPNEKELSEELDIPEDKIREFTQAMRGEVSLDSPISSSDDRTLEEVIEDNHADSPVMMLNLNMIQKELRKVLSTLSPKEAKVLTLRFGLEDNFPRTLNEIGEIFGLSRERIRQIEGKALKKLRSPQYLSQLGAYFHSEE